MLTAEEWVIVGLSLRVALASVAILAVPSIAVAWLLARRDFPGKTLLDVLVHLPLVIPPVVTGYLLLVLFGRRGVLGSWFAAIGLPIAFTWRGAVLAAAVMAFPLLVRPVRLAFELADPAYELAARSLGASPWRTFLRISLPLAAPGLVAGLLLAFARSLGEFGATITLAGNIPGQTRTLPVAVYTYSQVPDGDPQVMRLVVIAVVLSSLALLVSDRLARRFTRLSL